MPLARESLTKTTTMFGLTLLAVCSLTAAIALAQEPVEACAEIDCPILTEDVGGLRGSRLLDATEVLAEATEAGGLLYLDPTTAIEIVAGYETAPTQRAGSEAIVENPGIVREQLASGEPDGSLIAETAAEGNGEGNYGVLDEALIVAGEKSGGGERRACRT